MKVDQKILSLLGEKVSKEVEGDDFVDFLNQTEAGTELLSQLKKSYLEENDFPESVGIYDIAWEVVAVAYAPYVTLGDIILSVIGSDTFPDSKTLLMSDFRTLFRFFIDIIGKGISITVKPKQVNDNLIEENSKLTEMLAEALNTNFNIDYFIKYLKEEHDYEDALNQIKVEYILENKSNGKIQEIIEQEELSENEIYKQVDIFDLKEGVFFKVPTETIANVIIKKNFKSLDGKNLSEISKMVLEGEKKIYEMCAFHDEWWEYIVKQ